MKQLVYDVNPDFLLQPYRGGVKLAKPCRDTKESDLCIKNLNNYSAQVIFTDLEHKSVGVNQRSIEVVGGTSAKDIIGKGVTDFSSKEFGARVIKNYDNVLLSKSSQIIQENGARKDDLPIQSLAFRFPWFYENKVVGIFHLSILLNQPSVQNFAVAMSEVLATGLLGPITPTPQVQAANSAFTKREKEIIPYLLKGYSAKEIAIALFISKRTVEHHIENMKHKSCSNSTIELINKHYYKVIDDSGSN